MSGMSGTSGSVLSGWVVTETLLSRKPARGSLGVAAASVLLLLAGSLVYWTNAAGLGRYLPASREAIFDRSEYWRLFTSILAHADFEHLAANALAFGLLALLLYGYYGALVYPVLSLATGALTIALSLATYAPGTLLVGASGVVYWMGGFWLALYLLVERRLRLGKRTVRAAGFSILVFLPTVFEREVSYRTHAIGFGLGVAFGLAYFTARKAALRAAERMEME
jgi:rhomboid protease GluP